MEQHVQPIEYSSNTQKAIVLTNIVKMLVERGNIDAKNMEKMIDTLRINLTDNDTFTFDVSHTTQDDDVTTYQIILLLDQKILSSTKTSFIGDYIYKTHNIHKIIIVQDITQRAYLMIRMNTRLIEIFQKKEMMFNIVDHIYVPKHILLSLDESEKLINEYGLQKRELPRMLVSDPISKYHWAKIGQIFKIVRPSEMTGFSNYYRIVVRDVVIKK